MELGLMGKFLTIDEGARESDDDVYFAFWL